MILLALGGFLLVFGVFVFFKKNEGETEISLLGAKIKSNNSAILLICLGALLATFGAKSFEGAHLAGNTLVKNDSVVKPGPIEEEKEYQNPKNRKEDLADNRVAQLLGTWRMTETITGSEAVKKMQLSNSDIPASADISVDGKARVNFHRSNNYDAEVIISFLFRNLETEQYELKYRIDYSGTWQVKGNQIIETVGDGTVTPLSDLAILAHSSNPVSLADFNLQKGKTLAVDIVALSETQLVVKDPGTGERTTWQRNE